MNIQKIESLGHLFLQTVGDEGRPVLQWKEDGKYKNLTAGALKGRVILLSETLESFNILPLDKAAIISENRWEWVVSDFACILNRIITVPVYPTLSPEQMLYILNHSDSNICFISNRLILEKIIKIKNRLPNLKKIISYDRIENVPDYVTGFEDCLREREHSQPLSMTEKVQAIKEQDLLTIIYTSGTTDIPKGVCLTHKNIISNIKSCQKAIAINEKDIFLSFLPLAHAYERTAGYYMPLAAGAKIIYAQNIDTLSRQMEETAPTIITSVPLLFTRMRTKILASVGKMSPLRKKIVITALKYGMKYRAKKNHILWKIFDALVYRKLRRRLGGRMRFFVSGGSALNKETGEFFDSVGIKILEGYGMTEAGPVISVNREDNYKLGTVGILLDGVEVKIADDGEILVKGDNVMNGYYKDEKETREAIIDGWLHTGDLGEFENGFLKITDRKKDLIKTAGGKYVSLSYIENILGASKYIDQVITFGKDRTFITALIVPDFEKLKENADSPVVRKLLESEINHLQSNLAKYERVRRFTILPEPFTIQTGELTPTMKIKRKVVEEKYKNIIERMYDK